MKTIILGCGYVGLALMKFWHAQGQGAILGTTTSHKKCLHLQSQGLEMVVVKNDDLDILSATIGQAELLTVCVASQNGASYEETYLKTAEQIYACLQKSCPVKQLVYLSSTSVYGEQYGNSVDEDTPLCPNTHNSRVLVQTERMYLGPISELTNVSVLRLGGIYGPERTYSKRLERIRLHQPIKGSHLWVNAVHQEDIIRAIDWTVAHKLTGIYNVCADALLTRAQLYDQLNAHDQLAPLKWDLSETTNSNNKRVINAKIKATGFTFEHSCLGPEPWVHPLP